MSETTSKANAFVFKAFIEGQYRMCVCPRKDGAWSEKDIVYVDNPIKELYDDLEEQLFHVVFVVYEKDDTGFWIKPGDNPTFLKSNTAIAKEMYQKGEYFSTIEKGYQQIYEQQSSGEVQQAPTS